MQRLDTSKDTAPKTEGGVVFSEISRVVLFYFFFFKYHIDSLPY